MKADDRISQPTRVIVGHCPACSRVLVIENDGEAWPFVDCECGWGGTTLDIADRVIVARRW